MSPSFYQFGMPRSLSLWVNNADNLNSFPLYSCSVLLFNTRLSYIPIGAQCICQLSIQCSISPFSHCMSFPTMSWIPPQSVHKWDSSEWFNITQTSAQTCYSFDIPYCELIPSLVAKVQLLCTTIRSTILVVHCAAMIKTWLKTHPRMHKNGYRNVQNTRLCSTIAQAHQNNLMKPSHCTIPFHRSMEM